MEKLLLTANEAAFALNIGIRKLRELTNESREIPCVRIGGALRYDVADVKAFIDLKKERSCAGAPA
jgi:excisionase family DNA binding protein